ncbi:succinate dehydrogenase, cytochrome b556 subunit [bacterium]|nr:succinate dehydrogenase, cytochrome b556 subunit [bacterium]
MRYAVSPGMGAYFLHRLTGVFIWLFLLVHVTEMVTLKIGPDAWNALIALYRLPIFAVMEVVLLGALLFHGLNGLRVIIVDMAGIRTGVLHRVLLLFVGLVFLALFIPGAWLIYSHLVARGAG